MVHVEIYGSASARNCPVGVEGVPPPRGQGPSAACRASWAPPPNPLTPGQSLHREIPGLGVEPPPILRWARGPEPVQGAGLREGEPGHPHPARLCCSPVGQRRVSGRTLAIVTGSEAGGGEGGQLPAWGAGPVGLGSALPGLLWLTGGVCFLLLCQPWAFPARELLRKKLIGKDVCFSVEYKTSPRREYGMVYLGKGERPSLLRGGGALPQDP